LDADGDEAGAALAVRGGKKTEFVVIGRNLDREGFAEGLAS
jgi:hypothetical protein